MWTSKSDMFVPPAPIARASNATAITPSLSRPLATVEVREPPPPRPSRHPRRHAKEYGNISQISGRAHLIASAPLRSMIPSESDSSSEMESEKAKARKPKKAVKGGDCPPIDKDTKGAPKFLVTVLPGMNTRDSSTGS
uniref:Protein RecA (Recombinase A) n=1 Tax=Ganoderma boninense TaxID=34458 RepID=A0A5K1JY93_9APHY|nr:Protein RecA (Recombinase A) [Ganoderma boninense]